MRARFLTSVHLDEVSSCIIQIVEKARSRVIIAATIHVPDQLFRWWRHLSICGRRDLFSDWSCDDVKTVCVCVHRTSCFLTVVIPRRSLSTTTRMEASVLALLPTDSRGLV